MEVAWRCGMPLSKILKVYPQVESLAIICTNAPDDDVSVAVNGRMVHNPKTGFSASKFPSFVLKTPLQVGDWVEVFTYDLHSLVTHPNWVAKISYKADLAQSLAGGTRFSFQGRAKNNAVKDDSANYSEHFYLNGAFLIPPPFEWPLPAFLPDALARIKISTASLSTPTPSPLVIT